MSARRIGAGESEQTRCVCERGKARKQSVMPHTHFKTSNPLTYPASPPPPPPCGTPLSPMRARRKRVTVGKFPLVLYIYKLQKREGRREGRDEQHGMCTAPTQQPPVASILLTVNSAKTVLPRATRA